MKIASHTPLPLATARVSHGALNAMSATSATVNIAIGAASGARHRSGTRKTSSTTIGKIASTQCRTSTGTCGVLKRPSRGAHAHAHREIPGGDQRALLGVHVDDLEWV